MVASSLMGSIGNTRRTAGHLDFGMRNNAGVFKIDHVSLVGESTSDMRVSQGTLHCAE